MNSEHESPERAPPDWWRDFFEQSFGDLQLAGARDEHIGEECDFIEHALGVEPGAALLDAPCGPGRHAIELAARGFSVMGVDFNERVLARARERAAERDVAPAWHRGDLRELALEPRFDAAYCFWGSFGYFDAAGDRAFAAGVCRALAPGGRFLIDTHVMETLLPRFAQRGWSWWGDTRVLEERRWDLEAGRVEVTWTFQRDGREVSRPSSIRVYTLRELCELLRAVGFSKLTALEALTGEPFTLESKRLTLVATK